MSDEIETFNAISAENKHLKKQLERYLNGELGTYNVSVSNNENTFLPNKIDAILNGNDLFPEQIKKVLKELFVFSNCSRIQLFHYNSTNKSHISIECVNGNILLPKAGSVVIPWNDMQSFLKNNVDIVSGSIFNNTDLPVSFEMFFSINNEEPHSLLMIPLAGQSEIVGFIAFEEQYFNRSWHIFEINMLASASKMIAYAFQQNRYKTDNEKKEALNNYLLNVAEIFSDNSKIDLQIERVFEKTANFFGFGRIAIFQNIDNDYCQVTHEWFNKPFEAFGSSFQKISYSNNLPELKELLSQKKIRLCTEDNMHSACKFLDTGNDSFKLFVPVFSGEKYSGFICFDDLHKDKKWSSFELNTFIVISNILASSLDRQMAVDRLKVAHSELVRLTKVLKEKEQFLQTILSSIPVGVLLLRNREILFANNPIQEMAGLNENELIGRNISDFYYSIDESNTKGKQFYDSLEQKNIVTMELAMKDKNGNLVNTNVVGKCCPINGFNDSYLIIAQDVTALKQTQIELIESEERSRIILETTQEGVFILESADNLLFVNEAGCDLLGYSKNEIGNISVVKLFEGGDINKKYIRAIEKISHGDDYKSDGIIKNSKGDLVYVEMFGTAISIKGKPLFYLSLRNITERKRHENELLISEKKFRTLTENIRDHIIRISKDGILLFGNNAFFSFYNIKRDDTIGLEIGVISAIPKKFSSIFTCNDSYITDSNRKIEAGSLVVDEEYCVEWTISPETNGAGIIVSYLCVGRDITQRKKWEKELCQAKEKAESADKLKSAFLANMSHEIRTPLNAIVGFSAMLKEVSTSTAEKEEFIDIISKSSDNLMALITDIIDIAKIESGEFKINKKIFAVNELIVDIQRIFQRKIDSEPSKSLVKLVINIPEINYEPQINTDSNRLTQVFNNLLENAIKFTSEGFIELGYTIRNDAFEFYVQDTGMGIDSKQIDAIFQPFVQANENIHSQFGGTGLGLSICKHIIQMLGGTLSVRSEVGLGTRFTFFLPNTISQIDNNELIKDLLPKKTVKTEKNKRHKSFVWGDRIVLIIDDGSSTHLQLRKFLENTGITLISARTIASGRELIRNKNKLDLVLLDYQLSKKNYHSLISEISKHNSQLPVISLLSNDSDYSNYDNLFSERVNKPIVKDDLLLKMDHLFAKTNSLID
ncbi:MAG: PAS domain S-box protein [Marinilabiliaceae bacterium]|nr:PAS domain S-box protein [Marinilabiliaceae bacterium]